MKVCIGLKQPTNIQTSWFHGTEWNSRHVLPGG